MLYANAWWSQYIEFMKERSCLSLTSRFSPPSQLSGVSHFSPEWHSLQSIQTHAHRSHIAVHLTIHSYTATLLFFFFLSHTRTHERTPLVAVSATLLTGANQSYNTFIISSPPQAPSCWVKSHLGLFGCFSAEMQNYITDTEGLGLAGSSQWQLDTEQTRCERRYRTPQRERWVAWKKEKKTS